MDKRRKQKEQKTVSIIIKSTEDAELEADLFVIIAIEQDRLCYSIVIDSILLGGKEYVYNRLTETQEQQQKLLIN